MSKTNRQGRYTIGFRNAKTHEHVKSDISKTNGLAIARVSVY